MAPAGANLACNFKDWMTDYGNCHRFDQSAINILLALKYDYNTSAYTWEGAQRFAKILRQ
jgi:hypothetical protein